MTREDGTATEETSPGTPVSPEETKATNTASRELTKNAVSPKATTDGEDTGETVSTEETT
ncbi:MAG: hypothetical protein LBF41_04765 [Deltaproteobacteria bacterium]|jgi:hypothetical protein|nr:hypothetical protein [Deltaproteobacteria bacterium]